ncbi:macrolide family glycosyltransferase [Pseudonocardia charpentierae]|uniref:Glycosyltransferase n=1 Tax=Pseudonocardia charpentierae TaxID=3075545 RepID=A0ABU2NFB4_9PSEU|nr:macrolide family glycosyltransferase [Pseudonocardia sp. DSM 45834]MDT0352646.1 glycosyltransferase [Pseudonocardia sp. DSM 45834]
MSRLVLFACLAGHGHVTPTLPLVAELVRRGHRVEYACGPEFREAIGRAGAQWVAMPGLAPFVPPAQVGPEIVALWFRHFFAGLAATYPVLLAHCRAHRPDAVVYDATNWPARLVARRMGLRAARTIPNLAENETYSQVDDALTTGLEGDPQMAAFADDVAAFAAAHGVDIDVAGTMDVVEDLNLVFVARAFQPAGDSFDDRFRFVGAMIGGREQVQSWSSPHPGLPLLFVSLGSIFTGRPDFYRTCVEAFGDGHFQVAMTIGDVDPADVGPLPPTVQVASWFPQLAVLRQARAFITHAGMNSTMEALYYGVPMLALPQMPEQAVNADRVAALGLGVKLDPQAITADALRSAVAQVTVSPVIRTNLHRMQAEVRDAGGVEAGAQAIEEYLA